MADKVVVAGAGFLGINTALELSKKGYRVEIIDKRNVHEYTPGLIDIFRDRVPEKDLTLDLQEFFEDTEIKFTEAKVEYLNPDRKLLETDEGKHYYDYLVLALGAEKATYGIDCSKVESCYSMTGAVSLDKKAEKADSAIIVGSGYVGVEVAGELMEKGIDVTVVDRSTRPTANSCGKASKIALQYMNDNDISFKGGREVVEVSETDVELKDGETIEADMVVWSGGIQASKTVQKLLGTGRSGLSVNSGLCSTEYRDIFAGGDCADHSFTKTAHTAMRQAKTIATNIGKDDSQQLKSYSDRLPILLISLGDIGVLHLEDRAFKSRLFRYMKDLVRKGYFLKLKKDKLRLKLF